MFTIFIIMQVFCTAISFLVTIKLLNYNNYSKEYRMLLIGMVYIFIYNLACIFELNCKGEEAAVLIYQIKVLSTCHLMYFMFLFVTGHFQIEIPKWIHVLLMSSNLLTVTTAFFCRKTSLYFTQVWFETDGVYPHLEFIKGPVCYLYYGIILFTAISINVFSLFDIIKSKYNKLELKKIYLFVSTFLPVIAFILHEKVIPFYNPLPFALLISGILLVIGTYKYQMFDVVVSAKEYMIDTIKEGIIIVDSLGNYLEANQKAKEIFPKLQEKQIGDSLRQYIDIEEVEAKEKELHEIYKNGCWYECSITIVQNNKVQGYVFCIMDITQRKQYMENLILLREQADKANREKSRFLANMSHDLRTPMNAIIGMCNIAVRKEKEKEIISLLKNMEHSAKHLLWLINNILDISKIEAGKLELHKSEYGLEAFLYEIANMIFVMLAEKQVAFSIKIEDGTPKRLLGDSVRVREILMNILGNAVKFTQEGNIILYIGWNALNEVKGMLNIQVKDTGVGIKKEDLGRIFKEYEQVGEEKDKITGTGLGLSIVKELTELMNGFVDVQSEYGKGSVFSISIMQELADSDRLKETNITKESLSNIEENVEKTSIELKFTGKRILVVDDVSVNLKVMEGTLEPYEVVVETATSGETAIECLNNQFYDVVLMDDRMPKMSGREVLTYIRNKKDKYFKSLPIIVLTADDMYQENNNYLKEGFSDCLLKPVQTEKMERVFIDWIPTFMFQISIGIGNTGGKEETYKEILKVYWKEADELRNNIIHLWETDKENFIIKIHGLKGSSWNIGAEQIGNEAEVLERRAKEENNSFVNHNLSLFLEHLTLLLEQILEYLKSEVNSAENTIEKTTEELYKLIKEAFLNYDITVLNNLLEEVKKAEGDVHVKEFVTVAEQFIDELEYEKGAAFVEQWIQTEKQEIV